MRASDNGYQMPLDASGGREWQIRASTKRLLGDESARGAIWNRNPDGRASLRSALPAGFGPLRPSETIAGRPSRAAFFGRILPTRRATRSCNVARCAFARGRALFHVDLGANLRQALARSCARQASRWVDRARRTADLATSIATRAANLRRTNPPRRQARESARSGETISRWRPVAFGQRRRAARAFYRRAQHRRRELLTRELVPRTLSRRRQRAMQPNRFISRRRLPPRRGRSCDEHRSVWPRRDADTQSCDDWLIAALRPMFRRQRQCHAPAPHQRRRLAEAGSRCTSSRRASPSQSRRGRCSA
jgi:hypothetical protein